MADQDGQNKVVGMERIITNPGQDSVAHFISGLNQCEKKTVVWEIRNIAEFLKMSTKKLEESGITFDAGHCIGIPATWYFYFIRNEREREIVNYLELSPDSKARVVKIWWSISLSCEGETFASAAFGSLQLNAPLTQGQAGHQHGRYGGLRPALPESDFIEMTDNGKKALKITLTVNIFSNKEPVEIPKANPLKADDVISDFGKLLESEDGADLEISVPSVFGGELGASAHTRKVHKSILIARSPVFSRMFAENSEMVEAKTGKVVIEDLSPQGLGVLLHYIYTGKVLGEWVKVPAEILNAAEKYDLGRLKNYCGHNLMAAVTTKNAIALYKMAKLHKLSFAKSAIAEFVSKNAKAVLEEGEEDGSDDEDTE